MELKPIKLGKKVEFKYVPFSELIIPWEVCVDSNVEQEHYCYDTKKLSVFTYGTITSDSSRALKTMKRDDLEALKHSIGQFGLLKPFEVAELPEQLDFFFGRGRYVIIDGQRRYFAIRELLRLPTEFDERKQKDSLRTNSGYDQIEKAEMQAQEQFDKLSIRDYVLIPCLVYPYKTYLQMMRHSIEDHKFSLEPSRSYLEIADKMRQEGIPDLNQDDISKLWETRSKIREERQAIKKTIQEIRNGIKERIKEDKSQS